MWQNAKTPQLDPYPWKERLPTLGTPNLSFIYNLHAEWRPWGYLLEVLSQSAQHPNWECARTSCVHLSPVEAGQSCLWHWASSLCFADVWEVSARLWLLRSRAIKMVTLLPLGTKRLSFQGPDTISYVWKVIILKMGRNKGIFFPF